MKVRLAVEWQDAPNGLYRSRYAIVAKAQNRFFWIRGDRPDYFKWFMCPIAWPLDDAYELLEPPQ